MAEEGPGRCDDGLAVHIHTGQIRSMYIPETLFYRPAYPREREKSAQVGYRRMVSVEHLRSYTPCGPVGSTLERVKASGNRLGYIHLGSHHLSCIREFLRAPPERKKKKLGYLSQVCIAIADSGRHLESACGLSNNMTMTLAEAGLYPWREHASQPDLTHNFCGIRICKLHRERSRRILQTTVSHVVGLSDGPWSVSWFERIEYSYWRFE